MTNKLNRSDYLILDTLHGSNMTDQFHSMTIEEIMEETGNVLGVRMTVYRMVTKLVKLTSYVAVRSKIRKALANKGYSFQSEKGGKWSVIVKSGDRKLVLKEYGHMTLLEVAEWVKTAKQLNKEDIDKMFEKNTEKSNVKNDDCKIGGHVVPDDMAKNFGAVEVDGAVDVPDHTWDEEAEMKKDTDRFHVLA